jgi:hypothetical protein
MMNKDSFGLKEGEVPKQVISRNNNADPFVNKHTRKLVEEQKIFEKIMQEKGLTIESTTDQMLKHLENMKKTKSTN